jgi:hypothetical protein
MNKNPSRKNGAPGTFIIKHIAGDILGSEKISRGSTTYPDCWNVCMGTVEVFKLKRKDFEEFWQIQIK